MKITLELNHNPVHTIFSHGWIQLAPFYMLENNKNILWALNFPSIGGVMVEISCNITSNTVIAKVNQSIADSEASNLRTKLQWMFRSNESFDQFWDQCKNDSKMFKIAEQKAGALLRSGSLFEDVIKTLCTVNCTWTNTKMMIGNLCKNFGEPVQDGSDKYFCFPPPNIIASASLGDLRKVNLGFRSSWIHNFAICVSEGKIDLESWQKVNNPSDLRDQLLSIPGVGPYVADHILVMLGHYDYIPIDSIAKNILSSVTNESISLIRMNAKMRYQKWGKNQFLAYHFERILEKFDASTM